MCVCLFSVRLVFSAAHKRKSIAGIPTKSKLTRRNSTKLTKLPVRMKDVGKSKDNFILIACCILIYVHDIHFPFKIANAKIISLKFTWLTFQSR